LIQTAQQVDDLFQAGAFAAEFLGFFRLIPDVRVFQFPNYFIKAFALDLIVKGTPSGLRRALACP
jgi:hypothetical protein